MLIRHRVAGDVPELEALAPTVHRLDGYPPYMPDDDFKGFVASDDVVGSWVAVVSKDLVGHVAIHNGSSPQFVGLAADVSGIPPSRCGVVARLVDGTLSPSSMSSRCSIRRSHSTNAPDGLASAPWT